MSISILFPLSNLYNPSHATEIKTNLPARDSLFCDTNFAIDMYWHINDSISSTDESELIVSRTLFVGEILPFGSPNSFHAPISKTKLQEYAKTSKYPVYFGNTFRQLKREENRIIIFELQVNFETSSNFNFFNSHWSGSGLSYEFQNHSFFVTIFQPASIDISSTLDDSLLYNPIITRCSPTFRMKSGMPIIQTIPTGKLRYTENNINIHKFSDLNKLQYELQQPFRHQSAPCLGQRNRVKTRECLRRLEDIYSNDSVSTRKRTKSHSSLQNIMNNSSDQHKGNTANKLSLKGITTTVLTTLNKSNTTKGNNKISEDIISKYVVINKSLDRAEASEMVDTNTDSVRDQLSQLYISTDRSPYQHIR